MMNNYSSSLFPSAFFFLHFEYILPNNKIIFKIIFKINESTVSRTVYFALLIVTHIFSDINIPIDFRDQSNKFTATQVLESLALAAYIAAAVCSTLHAFVVKQRSLYFLGAITNCVAGMKC